MLESIDPFALKSYFDMFNYLRQELGDVHQDVHFLNVLRRAIAPIPFIDKEPELETDIFPPLKVTPHPALAGKRVGLVTSGGSGALVTLCGVKRALEEAGIEIAAISVCSGSAIWGSMIAAGLSAQEMVDNCLKWRMDYMRDLDWKTLRQSLLHMGRGFIALARGKMIEDTMRSVYQDMRLDQTKIPYYAILLNLDTNDIEYFGPNNQPDVPLARMVRVAVALPLFIKPVEFGGHQYVDGGSVNIFPVEPLLKYEAPFDHIIGVNVIMPSQFRGEDITGFLDQPLSLLKGAKQLHRSAWLELARKEVASAGDKLLLLEPLPYSEIVGSKFYEVFIDKSRWTEYILKAYYHTRDQLAAFR